MKERPIHTCGDKPYCDACTEDALAAAMRELAEARDEAAWWKGGMREVAAALKVPWTGAKHEGTDVLVAAQSAAARAEKAENALAAEHTRAAGYECYLRLIKSRCEFRAPPNAICWHNPADLAREALQANRLSVNSVRHACWMIERNQHHGETQILWWTGSDWSTVATEGLKFSTREEAERYGESSVLLTGIRGVHPRLWEATEHVFFAAVDDHRDLEGQSE